MDRKPSVSVLMPTYNRERYLPEAIESVLRQTYESFELLIVDDGSTDRTKEVVAPYLTDHRIKYFHKPNGGQSSGRNFGFKRSQGSYICFLDSDNKWLPNKLELCVNAALENPSYDVFYGDNIAIDSEGNELHRVKMKRHSGMITAELLKDNFVTINTSMLSRECYEAMGGLDEKFLRAPDYEFWLRLSTKFKFLYIPEYMALYRIMEDQISSDKDGRFKANKEILMHFFDQHPDAVSKKQKRIGLSHFYNRKARYESSKKRPFKASKDWLKSLAYYPFWPGPWKAPARLFIDLLR